MNLRSPITGVFVIALLSTVGCTPMALSEVEVQEINESTEEQKSLELGLAAACDAVVVLIAESPNYFPYGSSDEDDEAVESRRQIFQAKVATFVATMETIPRNSGSTEFLESLDTAAESAYDAALDTQSRSTSKFSGFTRELWDSQSTRGKLIEWHSAAQLAAEDCQRQGIIDAIPSEVAADTSYDDLLPFGAWAYNSQTDDFGSTIHTWISDSTTSDAFAPASLSLMVACWEDGVLLKPLVKPYSDAWSRPTPTTERGRQGVEVAFGEGRGIWESRLVNGQQYGLYPPELSEDFEADRFGVSQVVLEDLADYESFTIGAEFSEGKVSGQNNISGLNEVIAESKNLGCWR